MTKDEEQRLEEIYKDAQRGFKSKEKLSYADLCLLLTEMKPLRELILRIFRADASETRQTHAPTGDDGLLPQETRTLEAGPRPVPSVPTKAALNDPLRESLAPELSVLRLIRADAQLSVEWLGAVEEDEGRQLARLIARAAQWDRVQDLRDHLGERCKRQMRPATSHEQEILSGCLRIHNLIWQGRQATLADVVTGAAYDYKKHERGTPTGDKIRALWLPGLISAGGGLQKKPLVET